MVFPKLPEAADVRAQALPIILMPYLMWAFMGDMWAAAIELGLAPLKTSDDE